MNSLLKRFFVSAILGLATAATHAAPVVHDESSSGDLPNRPAQSVVYPLNVGANVFSGSMSEAATSDFDSFAFNVAEGSRVIAISISIAQRPADDGQFLGAFYHLQNSTFDSASPIATQNVVLPATEEALFSRDLPLEAGVYGLYNISHSLISGDKLSADWVISLHVSEGFGPVIGAPSDYTLVRTLADVNGNGFPEIATNRVRQVVLKDSKTGDWIRRIEFFQGSTSTSWNPMADLATLDSNGDGTDDLLVGLASHRSLENTTAELRDPGTGARLARIKFFRDGGWDPISVTTGDVNADGIDDLGVMARRRADKRVAVEYRRATNGRLLGKRVWFSP